MSNTNNKKKQSPTATKTIPGFTPVNNEGVSSTSLNTVPKRTFKEAQDEKKKKKQTETNESMEKNEQQKFKTDSEITGNKQLKERKLVRWDSGSDNIKQASLFKSLDELSDSSKPFDQFEVNKQKFNINSNYDEAFYNLKIDKNSKNYLENLKNATRLEEMMLNDESLKTKSGNQHLDEERGVAPLKEDDDEETKYSEVVAEKVQSKDSTYKLKSSSPISKKPINGTSLLKSIQKPAAVIAPHSLNTSGRSSPTSAAEILFKKGNTTRTHKSNEKLVISRVHLKDKDQTVKELKQFSKEFTIPKSLNKNHITKKEEHREVPKNEKKTIKPVAKSFVSFFDPERNPKHKKEDFPNLEAAAIFNYFENLENKHIIPKSFMAPPVYKSTSLKKYKDVLASSRFVYQRLAKRDSAMYSQYYPPPQQQTQFFGNMGSMAMQPRNGSFSVNMQSPPPQMVPMPMFVPPQGIHNGPSDSNPTTNTNSRSSSFNMGPPPTHYMMPPHSQQPPINGAAGYYIPMPMLSMQMPMMMGLPPNNQYQPQNGNYEYNDIYQSGFRKKYNKKPNKHGGKGKKYNTYEGKHWQGKKEENV